ncbi:MAG: LuxR C-terminal-related transcriptional regulator [Chloroflexota bacterium]
MAKSDKPLVKGNVLHVAGGKTVEQIYVGSPQWYGWLSASTKFTFENDAGRFIAQCEKRRDKLYWYAYRRRSGKLSKIYLGKSDELTAERLEETSAVLAGQQVRKQSCRQAETGFLPDSEVRIDTSLLPTTKVNVPALPQKLVARLRLTRQMNTPLTILYAPSGFGKSTLLNDWKQTCGYPVAWLSLDENDNRLQRFWKLVIAAFRIAIPCFGEDLLPQQNEIGPHRLPDFVSLLTNEIVHVTEGQMRLGLVLDDFHRIHNSEIYDFLQAWLAQLPPNLRLIIAGHVRPPLALGHLRAQGLVTELDANDLRFTLDEGVSYLRQYNHESPLAYDDLEKLVKHTEGWAAGLTLTALALGKQENRREFIDGFSGAHIYLREYFMETVLQRTRPAVQDFLLKTAILKHLNGSLCDAITGQADGEKMLQYLWQENLFIVRLDQQGWYRYHDLFAEMLYSQLQMRFPEEVPNLHQRAAQWYRQQYAPADAIYHLLSAEAWEEAALLIEEMALRELEQYGEDSRLLRWLQELPESVVQRHKTLLFVYLRLASAASPWEKIERFIAHIESNLNSKTAVLQTQDEREVLLEIQQMRRAWSEGKPFPHTFRPGKSSDGKWTVLNDLHLLKQIYTLRSGEIEKQVARLFQLAQEKGNLFVILMAGGVLARRSFVNGHLRRGEKIARQVLEHALALRGKLPAPASIALIALSEIYLERHELDMAQKYLTQVVETDPNPTSTNMIVQSALVRAKLQMAVGQMEDARTTLQATRELHALRPSGQWSNQDLLAYEALICIRQGQHALAETLLGEGGSIDEHPLSQLAQAEILLKKGQFQDAETSLSQLLARCPSGIQFEPSMGARVLLGLALFEQHKINQARQAIVEAVRLAAPERSIRAFLDWGALCAPLLSVILQSENLNSEARTFIKDVLILLGNTADFVQFSEAQMNALSISASISARELEVLHLMSAGCSNREMAGKLSISASTVKTHVSNIYAKLAASSRLQAITRAKELNLV